MLCYAMVCYAMFICMQIYMYTDCALLCYAGAQPAKWAQNATKCYKMLQNATKCYEMLRNATKCYKMLQNATKCYKMLQNATKCCKMLQNTTKCYKMLQECFHFHGQCRKKGAHLYAVLLL